MIDLSNYKTASRLSPHINAGASARLNQQPMVSNLSGEAHAAFCHGWWLTDQAEKRAGRTMPPPTPRPLIPACAECGSGPVYCRSCMGEA